MENRLFYTAQEVADLLGVRITTLRKYIREGKIGAAKAGRRIVVTPKSLDDFLNGSAGKAQGKQDAQDGSELTPFVPQKRGKRRGGITGAAAQKHAAKVKRESAGAD